MISFLFSRSASLIIGLDIGSSMIKAAVLQTNTVFAEIKNISKYSFPSYFAIWNYTKKPGNYEQTSNANESQNQHWTKDDLEQLTWNYTDEAYSIHKNRQHRVISHIYPLTAQTEGINHREVLALTFLKIKEELNKTLQQGTNQTIDIATAKYAIAVEPFISKADRYAILESAKLANMSIITIVDTPYAIATYYALSHRKEMRSVVGLVDVGSQGSWFSIFTARTMVNKQISLKQDILVTNGTLGTSRIDNALMKHKSYDSSYDYMSYYQSEMDYNHYYDGYYENEYNYYYNPGYKENQEARPIADSLRILLMASMSKRKQPIDALEVFGGKAYIDEIRKAITSATKLNISQTLNGNTSAAIGAMLIGARISGKYKLQRFVNPSTFGHSHIEVGFNDTKRNVFLSKNRSESRAKVHFKVEEIDKTNVTLYADEDYEHPLDILSFKPFYGTNKSQELIVEFGFNNYSLPFIISAKVGNREIEVKHFLTPWQFDEKAINESLTFIAKMKEIEARRNLATKTREDLENAVYDIQRKLKFDQEFKKYLNITEKNELPNFLYDNLEYLSQSDPYSLPEVFEQKFQAFKDYIKNIELRIREEKLIPQSLEALKKAMEEVKKFIDDEVPNKKPWLWTKYAEKLTKLLETYNSTSKWIERNSYDFNHFEKKHNPDILHDEIDEKKKILMDAYETVVKADEKINEKKKTQAEIEEENDYIDEQERIKILEEIKQRKQDIARRRQEAKERDEYSGDESSSSDERTPLLIIKKL